jgi:thiamine pyrophosphate-dependent acetolactate synthase large subunit-like protein
MDSCSNYPCEAEPNIGQFQGRIGMKLGTAIAEIMKREGIEILCGYPVNHLIEHAAAADIRPVMVRQERIGLHMADAISRVTSGRTIGAFCMQHGPGAENAMGGVAQCYGESVPVLVLPMGYARRLANIEPNFNSSQAMRAFAKSAEPINIAAEVGNIFRRAFTKLKNGRGGPVIVEIPADMWNEEVPEPLNYTPVLRTRYGADPVHVKEAGGATDRRQAAGDLCRPGRALRASLAAAEAAGRKARHPRHHQPWRQVVVSGDPPALARIGRPGRAARGAEIPRRGRRNLRHRLLVHGNPVRRRHAQRQNHHPFNAGPCAS